MTDSTIQGMSIDAVRLLAPGTLVTMLQETTGEDSGGDERTYPPGTIGEVTGLRVLPAPQRLAVTVLIGPQEGDEAIVNVFDEGDACFPFGLPHETALDEVVARQKA